MCAHTLTLFINLYFNIPAVLPELLILIEQSGTLTSKTSAEQENLTLILVFIYITYTKKKPYNKVSQLSAAVLVFKGLATPRQTKEFALVLTALFLKPKDLTDFSSSPNKSTSHHLTNKTTGKGKKETTKTKKGYQKQAASSLISKIV